MDPKGNYWGLYILGMWIFSFLGHLKLDDSCFVLGSFFGRTSGTLTDSNLYYKLGGGFKDFLCSSLPGEMIQFH